MNKKKDKSKKRVVVVNKNGQAHIKCSFNNIIISITNETGQVISWSSAGKMGFRGSKKNTPFAAQIATEDAVKSAYELGLRKVDIFIKGPGAGRRQPAGAAASRWCFGWLALCAVAPWRGASHRRPGAPAELAGAAGRWCSPLCRA